MIGMDGWRDSGKSMLAVQLDNVIRYIDRNIILNFIKHD